MTLSPTPILESLLMGVVLVVKAALAHFLLKAIARDDHDASFLKTLLVTALVMAVGLHGSEGLAHAVPHLPAVAVKWIVVFAAWASAALLLRVVCDLRWWQSVLGAAAMLGLALAADPFVPRLARLLLPEGLSYDEYRAEADAEILAMRAQRLQRATALCRGLDALATLTSEQERTVLRADIDRGLALYTERKALMARMSAEERDAYRREMARFMSEQGLATNLYSLAGLDDISTNDISRMAAAFAELRRAQGDTSAGGGQARSIQESLRVLVANLASLSLSAEDSARLGRFMQLLGTNAVKEAVDETRAQLKASKGSDRLAIAMLLAARLADPMARAAIDQDEGGGASAGGEAGLPAAATRGGEGLEPDPEGVAGGADRAPPGQASGAAQSGWTKPIPDGAGPALVSRRFGLGVLRVPADIGNLAAWAAAADALRVKGYARLSQREVVLLSDGTILKVGDEMRSIYQGGRYQFRLECISNGAVTVSAILDASAGPR